MPIQKFIHPLPKTILDDSDKRPFFEYLVQWLQYNASSTLQIGNDLTSTQIDQIYSQGSDNSPDNTISFDQQVQSISLTKKTISNETYTASNFMFINMTNNSTLFLPQYPTKDSVVFFTKDNTVARLNGNGKKVNGVSGETVFYNDRLARQIHYFDDVGEWFFV